MEELKEKLLSRIDFSILITITIALGSLWRLAKSATIVISILVGAYFLMGLFLCFVKCMEIFGEKEIYKKLSEDTAYTFFNSWFYALTIYFFCYTIDSYISRFCFCIFTVFLSILFVWALKNKRLKVKHHTSVTKCLTIWYLISSVVTTLLSLNITIDLDKEFYDYTDQVYITFGVDPVFGNEVNAVFIDKNCVEITEVTVLKGNTYVIPADKLYNKDIYAVYSYPFKMKKERVLRKPEISEISQKARIKKLPIKIRMPEENQEGV